MAESKEERYARYNERSAEDRALKRVAETLAEKIEAIKSDLQKPWFSSNQPGWPKVLSEKEYNGMNALVLLLLGEKENYKVPAFATFEHIANFNNDKSKDGEHKLLTDKDGNALSRVSVLKGSKSFPAFLTTYKAVHNETKVTIDYDAYKQLSSDKQNDYHVFPELQTLSVFNVEQTNIQRTRPELYTKLQRGEMKLPKEFAPDAINFPAIDKILKEDDWLCPIHSGHQDKSAYSPVSDEILLPGKEKFHNGESFYGSVLQEMAYSTGLTGRLNRFGQNSNPDTADQVREGLIGELSSALIMQKYGLCKRIDEQNSAYLESWVSKLEESPEFIKSILHDVKNVTKMINAKIETINYQLIETNLGTQHSSLFPVTQMPAGVVSEFHLADNESRDAIYHLLHNNLYSNHDGKTVTVSRPEDRVVRLDIPDYDYALDCVYNNLDSETLSKIVSLRCYYEGHPIENYTEFMNDQFTSAFEQKRNDPNWVKAQGLEGNVKWDINFISDDGYHLVKATSNGKRKMGALDHTCNVFLPFMEIGEKFSIEDDLGYMTELRKRLLSKEEKVDSFGRITFAGPPIRDTDSGIVQRRLLIDGEAEALFILRPDDNIYDLNFILDLEKSEMEEQYAQVAPHTFTYNKEKDIYQASCNSIGMLLHQKDIFYLPRIINDKVNLPLLDFWETEFLKDCEKQEKEKIVQKTEVYPGLHAFQNKEGLWGALDNNGRTVIHPRWVHFQQEKNGDILFNCLKLRNNQEIPQADLAYSYKELEKIAAQLHRLSNVRIEQRGQNGERWIGADIDGEPAVSEKITERDWIEHYSGLVSPLNLAMKYFTGYLNNIQQELLRGGMHIR